MAGLQATLVIGVAGRSGSGKSQVARALEQEFGFQYVRYSLTLAEWQKTNPANKVELQRLGWEVMSGPGQFELNHRLIEAISPERDCAVDGLRHPIDYDCLQKQFLDRFRLVFVDTPNDVRFERLRSRYSTWKEFQDADSHLVESHIPDLMSRAAVILSGTMPREYLVSRLATLIESFRSDILGPPS